MKNLGHGSCTWLVREENGSSHPCGRLFTKYDARQEVCPAHGDAYQHARLKRYADRKKAERQAIIGVK